MKKNKLLALILALVMVLPFALTACQPTDPTPTPGAKTYTYRAATVSITTNWNTHTYQSNDAKDVLGYTEDGLYTFDYNEDKDGYVIIPSMATEMPIDVSEDYAEKFGYDATEEGRAYKIPLRNDLKFQNGDAINAQTFVDSIKLLLNPAAANQRASDAWTGNMKIFGAESYAKQGRYALAQFVSANFGANEYVNPEDFVEGEGGVLTHNGKDVVLDINSGGNWGSNSLSEYAAAGYLVTGYEMDEATGRVKVFDTEGTWILTRTLEKDETTTDYIFYDLEGNKLPQRQLNADETAWIYYDKDGKEVAEWAGCKEKALNANYDPLAAAADENGWVKLTKELLKNLQDCIAQLHGYATVEEYAAKCAEDENFTGPNGDINYAYVEFEEMAFLGSIGAAYDWENVGVLVDPADPLGLIIILEQPLTGFYLNYSLSSSLWLVHPATYEACTKMTGGVYSNDYATSKDKYVGFGPYQIDTYTADHSVTFKKNNNWWGFTSGEQSEFYQTTNISIVKVTEESTRLEMFLKGELDSYGLTAEDMEDYQGSDYTYYTEGDSTWFVAMNPDPATLAANEKNAVSGAPTGAEIDKQILTIKEFRQALSFSLNRAAYALELDPLGAPAKALYGNMIISDPETGTAYRTTEEAKDTILAFWGLTDHVGPGKDYATKDEAIASITGYDPSGAKTLFTQAYEKAVELGYISAAAAESGNFRISIIIGRPAEAAYYDNGYQFLSATWTKAVEGTPLEGKLLFTQSAVLGSTEFANRLRDGTVDLLFGVGWTGSALDPYGLMQAYVDPGYQYDPSWDTTTSMVDIELDLDGKGVKTYRASAYAWGYEALSSVEIKTGTFAGQYGAVATVIGSNGQPTEEKVVINAGVTADATLRLKILAAVEKAVLEQYNMIPVNSDSSASLKGMRIVFGTEEYIYGVGRGGVKYMTYTADDAAWTQYVKDQGGTLNYK